MSILLERISVPERGLLQIEPQSIDIRITSEEARRKVAGWLRDAVSDMMRAAQPTLVIADRVVWRVPAILTSVRSETGEVGTVGTIDVDVVTGEMEDTPQRATRLLANAAKLASKLPPYRPMQGVSGQLVPASVSPAIAPHPSLDD